MGGKMYSHEEWFWTQSFGLLFWVVWAGIVWLVLTRKALLPGSEPDDWQSKTRFITPFPHEKEDAR